MNQTSSTNLRRSLYVMLGVVALISPPLIAPGLRDAYAPLHDGVWLWLVGNVWYRFLPLSPILLIPLALLLGGLWLAWVLQVRFVNRLQMSFTSTYVRLFPGGGIYRRLKTVQVYWAYVTARLPDRYRSRFPFKYTAASYDISSVSDYYLKVSESMRNQWFDASRFHKETAPAAQVERLIIESGVGTAGLYVPSLKCAEVISSENFARAIVHLDNIQIHDTSQWQTIQELFRHYAEKTEGLDVSRLSPHRIKMLLEGDTALDRTILLRMLINIWIETRNPAISAVVTSYVGTHIRQVYHLFQAILNRRHDDLTAFEPEPVFHIQMHDFQRRYLHFLAQTRGVAAVTNTRKLMEDISHKARQVHGVLRSGARDGMLNLLFNTYPDLEHLTDALASEWIDLLHSGDLHQQAELLASQYGKLQTHRRPVGDAMWTAMFRSGDSGMLDEAAVREEESA